jgi:hypothetical protein
VLLKLGFARWKVSFPYGVARETNYNILSEGMAYYLRYAIKKNCVMRGFSMQQLVTSELEAIDFPEAEPKQSLPCPFHVPATRHSIVSVCPTSTRHNLPPVIIMIRPWDFAKIPPLFCNVMNASTDPHGPTCPSFGPSSAWHR